MDKLKAVRGLDKKNEEEKKPTHFDLAPFLKAFKKFLSCDGAARSQLRTIFKKDDDYVKRVFEDEYGEASFKKCVNI